MNRVGSRLLLSLLIVLAAGTCADLRNQPANGAGGVLPASGDVSDARVATDVAVGEAAMGGSCRTGSERCRGICQETSRMIGVCLAAAGSLAREVYWCDPDDLDERILKWKFSERQVIELGYDPNDPGVLDQSCLGASNGMLGTYCSSGRFVSGRAERMDVVFIYSARLDSEGKVTQLERTPGTQSRTCRP